MKKIAHLLVCLVTLTALLRNVESETSTTTPASDGSPQALEAQTIRIAPKCVACTVGLVSTEVMGNRIGIESGSGVLISADGLILTAGHVITAPGTKLTVRFTNGKVFQGVAVGLDHLTDTGLARITDPAPAGGFDFCEMAPDQSATQGEWVLATGNPGSIVVDRNPPVRLGRVTGHDARTIATNCALEPGDSGGPVFDLNGRVVGINSRIAAGNSPRRMQEYLSLHVPISLFHSQWKDLLAGMNANPDVNLGGGYVKPKPVPGISARTRAALNKLAADNDSEAKELLANEKKTGSLKPSPAMMERLMKLAARMDRESPLASTHPSIVSGHPATVPAKENQVVRRPTVNAPPDLQGIVGNRAWLDAGKTSRQTLSMFLPAFHQARSSVVEIRKDKEAVLLGTIVDSDGLVLTKASDLPANPLVALSDGKVVPATLLGKDLATDLALLKITAGDLTAIQFDETANLGEWIEAATTNPDQPAIGIVSHAARRIAKTFAHFEGEQKIVLGVGFTGPTSTTINRVMPGMPAEAAGMQAGDSVFLVNGHPVADHDAFLAELKKAKTGDTLDLMVHRNGKDIELKPVIGQTHATTETSDGIGEADNLANGQLSNRRTDFPLAIQTDAAIWGNECGGPLVNLQGKAIGITIARYDRVCTFAIPARLAQATIKKLKSSGK